MCISEDAGEGAVVSEAIVEDHKSASESMTERGEACHDPEHKPVPRTTQGKEECHDPEHRPEEPEPFHKSSARGTETAAETEHQPVEAKRLHESGIGGTEMATDTEHQSASETTSSQPHGTMQVLQAIGLLPFSSGKQPKETSEKPSEKALEGTPEASAQPDPTTLPPLPASPIPEPVHDPSLEEPTPMNRLSHLMSSESSATSVRPEATPEPFSTFRDLPAEPAPTLVSAPPLTDHERAGSPSGVRAPFDTTKLPPPRILVIRASNDSSADLVRGPFTPDIPDDFGNPLENVNTTVRNVPITNAFSQSPSFPALTSPDGRAPQYTPLQGAGVQDVPGVGGMPGVPGVPDGPCFPHGPCVPDLPGIPEVPLPTSELISEDLGAVNVAKLPSPARRKRRTKMIRKTRKVVLRSPVLSIILGRQLALLTRPAIKIIAKGGELPQMAVVGQAAETVGAIKAPIDAIGAVGAAAA